jgi:hypothetical protein
LSLFRSQLVLAPTARIVYALTLTEDQTYEELFKPDTWAHVARDIPRGTIIEVMAHDGSWWAELLVRASGQYEVTVGELRRVQFDELNGRDESEYTIAWAGRAKFRITRNSDRVVMKDGFATKAQAEAWIKSPVDEAEAA